MAAVGGIIVSRSLYMPILLKNAVPQTIITTPKLHNGVFDSPVPTPTPPPVTIETLMATLDTAYQQGQIDQADVYQTLRQSLNRAKRQINKGNPTRAVKKLETFLEQVAANREQHITPATADQLTTIAQQLITQLQQ